MVFRFRILILWIAVGYFVADGHYVEKNHMDQQIKPWTSSESFILYTNFPIRWHNQDSVDFFAVELFMFFFYLRDILFDIHTI